ncbi:MAG: hypothetical protein E6767_11955 [Dysgonomonas sp.]|nr:hypothetical protein [Dysgonomonas sp.]
MRTENRKDELLSANGMKKKEIYKKNPIRPVINGILISGAAMMVLFSCKKVLPEKIMTEDLYMQYQTVKLELPYTDDDGNPNSSGGAILSEIVSYTNRDEPKSNDKVRAYSEQAKLDADAVYKLNEVVVESRSTFTPERDGRVSVDFLIRVPEELISDKWSITLQPKLLHNDSIVDIDDIVIRGEEFADWQDAGYEKFDDYLAEIVEKRDYDSVFLDHKGIMADMRRRQTLFLNMYRDEYKELKDYESWKSMMQSRYNKFNIKKEVNRKTLYHEYMREAEFARVREHALGNDTTGITEGYMKRYNRRVGILPHYKLRREINEKTVPRRYKETFVSGRTTKDIKSHAVSVKDSVEISKHRYFFDKIAENELRDSMRNLKFQELVPFEIRKDVHLDTIVSEGNEFVYLYNYEYPVTAGLKKIRITMDGYARAMDRSGYTFPPMDTLTYLISSIDQLIDTTLVVKKTKVYREMYSLQTIYPKFEKNKSNFNIRYKDNEHQIDTLISSYNIFLSKPGVQMDSVVMTATTSLDGTWEQNVDLSEKRALAIKSYLNRTYNHIDVENVFKIRFKGEDWNGLVRLIQKRDDMPNKGEILHMISNATYPDDCEQEIKKQFKEDYRIMYDSIYPQLHKLELAFNMSRPGMSSIDSVQTEYRSEYDEGLRLLKNRQYWDALEILADYPDYNTALCLTSMGYNDKAYNLLVQLEPTSNIHYLLAIVCYRMDRKETAVAHLLKACELDTSKIYRAPRDMETKSLINMFRLKPQLDAIESKAAEIY